MDDRGGPARVIDADNHYYEPRDCFTRFMASSHMEDAIRVQSTAAGDQVVVGDRPFTFLPDPFGEVRARPGALREKLRNLKAGMDPDSDPVMEPVQPAYVDRDARLSLMDEQGIDAALLFPTLGVCVEHFMADDPRRTSRNLAAFNRWLLEDWGFGGDGRIYGVPLVSLLDVDAAVAELAWLIDEGARCIHLRPGPQAGRCPADPVFDPFWARADEAGLTVAFHIAESGFNERYSTAWGEVANPPAHQQSAFQWTSFYGDLPIMQTLAGLVFYNFFGRFPRIRVLSVENGSLWVPYLLAAMDKMKGMGRNGPWPGGYVAGRPSEIVREKVFVSPYHEEDIGTLAEAIGVGQVVFGSDFPHPEGLARPTEFRELLTGMSAADQDLVMGGNAERLVAARQ